MRSDNLFVPVQGLGISGKIALQIEKAILEGKIQPGERLSSERDLQLMFQAGRGAIREALKALKQQGIIEIKKGVKGGAYIKHMEVANVSEPMALLLKQKVISLDYLVEFRDSIDRTVAILSSTRGDEEERKQLVEMAHHLLEVASQSGEPDMEKISEIDQNLNLLLAKMTKNPVFEWITRTIQLSIGSYDSIIYEDQYYRNKTIANWVNTAKAVAAGETLQATSFCSYHYVLLRRCIKEKGLGTVEQEKR